MARQLTDIEHGRRNALAFLQEALMLSLAGALLLSTPVQANAQRPAERIRSDRWTEVYRERIVVLLPLPYISETRPNPPVPGYFAWKMAFGGDADATVVFRTDAPIELRSNRQIISDGTLYVCPPDAASVLSCTQKARGSARVVVDALQVEITEPSIVARVKEKRPEVVLRQVFEPGGRYRVDYVSIIYNSKF